MTNIDDLLKAEKGRKGFTRAERDAMWKGIQRSIAVGAAVGVASTAAAAGAAKGATAAATATKLATWKLILLLSAVAIVGAGAGAAAHAKWGAPKIVTLEAPPRIEAQPAPIPSPTITSTPPPPIETATATAPSATTARPRSTATTSAEPAAKDPSLARERTLLDMARTALSRGDATGALASLDTHAKEFPSSQLSEEREVLAIQALAAAGRMPEARKRATSFRTRFVNSPMRSIVDEATQ